MMRRISWIRGLLPALVVRFRKRHEVVRPLVWSYAVVADDGAERIAVGGDADVDHAVFVTAACPATLSTDSASTSSNSGMTRKHGQLVEELANARGCVARAFERGGHAA